jgi:integrase
MAQEAADMDHAKADSRPRKPGGARRKPAPGEEHLTTREGSPHWHYDFSIDGHRLRGGCGTADFGAAAAFAASLHAREFDRIRLGKQPPAALTLEQASVLWWQDRGEGTTYGENGQRHQVARMLRILGGETPLATLDDPTVARLVRGLRAGEGVNEGHEARGKATAGTVNRYLQTLKQVCDYAREIQHAQVGAWQPKQHKMREPKDVERFLSHEQGGAVVSEIVAHSRAPITLALSTGSRKSNWLLLEWEQVSLDLGRALVRGKGDKMLAVTLPPVAVRLLTWLQPDPAKRAGPVFTYGIEAVGCTCPHCVSPLYRGQPIKDVRRGFKTAARKAGVPNARLHDLRHSFASWLLNQTGDLRLVQEALHHTTVATTMRYAKLMGSRKADAIAAATAGLGVLPAPKTKKEDAA